MLGEGKGGRGTEKRDEKEGGKQGRRIRIMKEGEREKGEERERHREEILKIRMRKRRERGGGRGRRRLETWIRIKEEKTKNNTRKKKKIARRRQEDKMKKKKREIYDDRVHMNKARFGALPTHCVMERLSKLAR